MDEEKRKYLEELKKQIDPEILSKMADYLGSDGDGAVAGMGEGGSAATASMPLSASSPADRIRERRAMQFQERVARRKRENTVAFLEKEAVESKDVLVYGSNDLWTRIVENQFRTMGFTDAFVFSDFSQLIKHLLKWSLDENRHKVAVGVAYQDFGAFLRAWEHLRGESERQPQFTFLHEIQYFVVVEYLKEIQDALIERLGHDHIICITDDLDSNREKVERSLITGNQRSEE